MSETSSDAESSCGWTIVSNEGSDIETLGSEVAVEYGVEPLECPHVEEAELQDAQASAPDGVCVGEAASVENTVEEQTLDETLEASKAADNTEGKEHMLSFSDHSDIVTLGDLKDDEHTEQEAGAANTEDLYLGSSSSSQYTFRPAEPVLPVQPPTVTNSSSSEDEPERSASTIVRRRRLRKNTMSLTADQEEEEEEEEALLVSHPREDKQEEKVREQVHQQEEPTEVKPAAGRRRLHSIFITCILLGLLIAVCMGFGHFYSKMFHDDPRDEFICGGADSFHLHDLEHFPSEDDDFFPCVSDESGIIEPHDEDIHQLRQQIEKLKNDHLDLVLKQIQIQAERDDLQTLLQHEVDERMSVLSEQQRLSAENQLLKNSLEREEKSLAALQEELRNLRSQIKELETLGAGADSLLLENQRLKEQLEEEKRQVRNVHGQRENIMVEAQTLRKKLEKERKATDELRRELSHLRSRAEGAGKEASSELQSRLMALEKRLNFEQQRSDLWERLYVETKEDRAKGDVDAKVKKSKRGVAGKMKETFDAVKNSTKEFVHHHKEQIKKAKEAVKENLRKFSDSVKSTFRNFKDSASTFMNKARGFYNKKRDEKSSRESWQHRSHKPHHRHKPDPSQSSHNTRKSGGKVHEDRGHSHRAGVKGCSGVFDCAYQESMSLFNKAMEPIRADEFHQLLQSYVHQEVDHFHHWEELETFISGFFHNGLFIHDQMLFTDFVSGVESYLADMHEYHGLADDVFRDLDDFIYRHFFGESYDKSGPFEGPSTDSKEESRAKHQQRKQQRARARAQSERKWSRSGRNADRHMADVKIELGPMPFDPKY
ncbi:cell cycle progression protein 1 isoform X2 [Salarias fasciatus]|uniref:cell cycle progression protein 1 isoform X2 n=1 Tax=Salarias fasciatus TaxID=181472 RepID=UPI0011768C49|nr:cell cycle progression protein 1 isoform X2 [Salarias fasciatus]